MLSDDLYPGQLTEVGVERVGQRFVVWLVCCQSHDEAQVDHCHAFKRRDDVPVLRELRDALIYPGR